MCCLVPSFTAGNPGPKDQRRWRKESSSVERNPLINIHTKTWAVALDGGKGPETDGPDVTGSNGKADSGRLPCAVAMPKCMHPTSLDKKEKMWPETKSSHGLKVKEMKKTLGACRNVQTPGRAISIQ